MSDWIKCSERLPDDHERVLAYFPKMGEKLMVGMLFRRDDGISYTYGTHTGHAMHFPSMIFTHWQPLPEPPK